MMNRSHGLWKTAAHVMKSNQADQALFSQSGSWNHACKRLKSEIAVRDSTAATMRQLMVDTMSLVRCLPHLLLYSDSTESRTILPII